MTVIDVDGLLRCVRTAPDSLLFADVLAAIDQAYVYTPTLFTNGLGEHKVVNEPGANEGACRVFGFAHIQGLSEINTLGLFAEHYRAVKEDPQGTAHANIRMFMRFGWAGISFDGAPLVLRNA